MTSVPANLSLRERKKRAVMDHIQAVALDLFDDRGFGAVTIEEIAAAAGVSPSTVYRHFGTKDRLVLHDEIDREMLTLLFAHFPEQSLIGAARATLTLLNPALDSDEYRVRRRARYMVDEPSVNAALMIEISEIVDFIAPQLVTAAAQADRHIEPVTATIATELLLAGLMAAVRAWRAAEFAPPFRHYMETALDALDNGLPL